MLYCITWLTLHISLHSSSAWLTISEFLCCKIMFSSLHKSFHASIFSGLLKDRYDLDIQVLALLNRLISLVSYFFIVTARGSVFIKISAASATISSTTWRAGTILLMSPDIWPANPPI